MGLKHDTLTRALNGASAATMRIITEQSPHQEASPKSRTFDLVVWILDAIKATTMVWAHPKTRLDQKNQRCGLRHTCAIVSQETYTWTSQTSTHGGGYAYNSICSTEPRILEGIRTQVVCDSHGCVWNIGSRVGS